MVCTHSVLSRTVVATLSDPAFLEQPNLRKEDEALGLKVSQEKKGGTPTLKVASNVKACDFTRLRIYRVVTITPAYSLGHTL
jgi:hypothetical protein